MRRYINELSSETLRNIAYDAVNHATELELEHTLTVLKALNPHEKVLIDDLVDVIFAALRERMRINDETAHIIPNELVIDSSGE